MNTTSPKTLNRLAASFLVLTILAGFSGAASAQTIIYADGFSGSSATNLNGLAPDVRSGADGGSASATWAANSGWKADGSNNAASGSQKASLTFTPDLNKVYTLSLQLNPTAGTGLFMLGFSSDSSTTFSNGAAPYLTLSDEGTAQIFTSNNVLATGTNTFTGLALNQTAQVVLDTTGAAWTAAWFYNGTQLGSTFTYVTNPTSTGFVKFARSLDEVGTVDNFQLSAVPEPSTWALLAFSLTTVMVLRRRRHRGEH
ncbi:MAG: PEP-CTERM sorting domain-containing protein [Terrimicrobiaceae bacterium]